MGDELDPIAPEAALDLYLSQRASEVSDQTLQTHHYRLERFIDWCQREDITNLNVLTGRDLHAYRVFRSEEDGLKPVTLQGQLSTLRVFMGFCASIDAVPEGLRSKILLPTVSGAEQARETTIDPARAEAAIEYLDRYQYASRQHVVMLLLWRTGMRTGAIRSLDLEDIDLEDDSLELKHRPETDTPLKNQERGERWVALAPHVSRVVEDHINGPRIDREDKHGREPLLTTREGRVHSTTIRQTIYGVTRPCKYGEGCPHDRDVGECEATSYDSSSKCPSSRSPHEIRSGAITAHLLDDVPTEIVSDRMDVSATVLDRHYDRRTKREKMEQRRRYLRE
ncbi:site-specific integrase [Halomarina oriensis]|uniref:Tyrosine-type recombinase/integrase n=1 Tax=Halomarina oriensis TaxID=671145 RepID=A0A6B0GR59_9EURY|nr:tyrosine-type recombinase/integrase [Halomarina oriensis]MWG34148.1 tyrosine-type recombinase/integrase [Halomarina oriensis]